MEFSLFLSIVSILALSTTIAFADSSSTRAHAVQTGLNNYAIDPQTYECAAGGKSYC